MEGKTGCYIYTRVSTGKQVEGFSLDAQETTLRKYADLKSMEIVHHYSDRGRSGKSVENRPEFMQMIDDVEQGKDHVQYILVFKLSRFGRSTADVVDSLDRIQKYNVNLISVEDGIDSSKGAGKLIVSVLAAVAEMERENILAQTFAGRMQKAREGKWNGGPAPYGYKVNSITGILEVDEDQAKIVNYIFDKYVNTNLGYTGISALLQKEGIEKQPIRERDLCYFGIPGIKKIIDNPVYCGKIVYGRTKTIPVVGEKHKTRRVKTDDYTLYPGMHEPIISEDLFYQARAKRKSTGRATPKRADTTSEHILSGLLVCPVCGGTLVGHTSRKKRPDKQSTYPTAYSAYECKHRKTVDGKPCAYKKIWHEGVLDNAVAEIVRGIIKNDSFAKKLAERLNGQVDVTSVTEEVKREQKYLRQLIEKKDYLLKQQDGLTYDDRSYERKFADLQKRIDMLYDDIADQEVVIDDANTRLNNLNQELINIQTVYSLVDSFSDMYDLCTEAEKKELLKTLINRIEIFEEQQPNGRIIKSIEFKFPIYFDGENGDNVNFLSNENTVETVCLLSKLHSEHHIEVELNLDEMDLTASESKATYEEIKAWVLEHSGLKVSSLYIAQVKRKNGIIERENYNKPKNEDVTQPQCPPDKEKAITEALEHFGMLPD